MCKVDMLRELMKQRLKVAVEGIYDLFERTILEYEEEICRITVDRQRQGEPSGAILNSPDLQQADVRQVSFPNPYEVPLEKSQRENTTQCLPLLKEEVLGSLAVKSGEDSGSMASVPDTGLSESSWVEVERSDGTPTNSNAYGKRRNIRCQSDPKTDPKPAPKPDSNIDPKPFTCPKCKKGLGGERNLRRHMLIHLDFRPYACYVCENTFSRSHHLKRHLTSRSHIMMKRINSCGNLKNQSAQAPMAPIPTAPETTAPETESPETAAPETVAPETSAPKTAAPDTAAPGKSNPCLICAKGFAKTSEMEMHMRTHAGIKPFHCNVCKKSFTRKRTLRYHKCVVDG
ncbi:uncharacterized protein LOC144196781 [Stigmatopora nigra]